MRPVVVSSSTRVPWVALFGAALLAIPALSQAQSTQTQQRPDTRSAKDFAHTGQLNVQIQDVAGAPFFQGATVKLLTRDIATTLSTVSDAGGHAVFSALPVGQYLMEITAAGFRNVQQQVLITGTRESQDFVVSMVPSAADAKAKRIKVGAVSVSPKAIKEFEKAVEFLQLNLPDEAHQHLERVLVLEPNLAEAHYLMGVLLLRQKEPARAAAYLQKSLALAPDQAPALLALGQAQYLEPDYLHASESLQKFLSEHPHDPQAPIAQKYLASLRKVRPASTAAGSEIAALGSDSAQLAASDGKSTDTGLVVAPADLPPLFDSTAATETSNWAPPDVDDEKLALDANASCQLAAVMHSAAEHVQELVKNVDRFTATENVEHTSLSPMGMRIFTETRKFNYLVEIHAVGTSDLNVEEYRKSLDAKRDFPEEIVTVGLPSLALIFHPNLQSRYDFECQGRGVWQGKPAWVVRFQQRAGANSGMLVYHVANRSVAVGLKGRAWIDTSTSQIVAMESDIVRPVNEIRLLRDHQLIEYGPVSFRNNSLQLWLPKSADWYCSISGKHFHRRHAFSQFLLFSVDEKQQISAPPEPPPSENPHPSAGRAL